MKVDFAPIFELGLSEKLQLLEDLWDDIATQSANLPVLDWQKEELDQRKALHLQDLSLASSWDSVKAMILREKREHNGLVLDMFHLGCPHPGCQQVVKLKSPAQLAAFLRRKEGQGIL